MSPYITFPPSQIFKQPIASTNERKKDSSQAFANFTHISTADKQQKILLISYSMPSAFYLQKALNKSWLFLYKKILLWKMRLKERVDPNLPSTALCAAPCRQSACHRQDALISHFIFLFVPCHPWQWLGILFVFKSIWLSCRLRLVCKYFSPVIMYY